MKNFIEEKTLEVIGLNKIFKQLDISCPYGHKQMQSLSPFKNKDALLLEYHYMEIFLENNKYFDELVQIIHQFKDITQTIHHCLEGKILDIVELFEIKIQALLMNELKNIFNVLITEDVLQLEDTSSIIELLSPNKDQVTYEFFIYNTYSDKLKEIRELKRSIELKYFQCEDETTRELIKKDRLTYVALEEEEEDIIRKQLSIELRYKLEVMKSNISKVGHIDLLIAKTKLALKYEAIKPQISNDYIFFRKMMHPLMKEDVEKEGHVYTENSIELVYGSTVITGANMSGKSSILKAVTLNVILSQLGFYVFAKQATVPLIEGIVYIGYENDAVHGLSSFGQEMKLINEAIKKMKTKKILICLDEFARSTNPFEGQKFVKAFTQFACTYPTFSLISTHFDGVANKNMNHYQIVGLKEDLLENKISSIMDINQYMDYTLKKVSLNQLVPKEAYKVSLLLNIDEEYLEYLKECYRSDANE